jgi:hypothetical protein
MSLATDALGCVGKVSFRFFSSHCCDLSLGCVGIALVLEFVSVLGIPVRTYVANLPLRDLNLPEVMARVAGRGRRRGGRGGVREDDEEDVAGDMERPGWWGWRRPGGRSALQCASKVGYSSSV